MPKNFKKDMYQSLSHKKPLKPTYSCEQVLKRLSSRNDKPTDEEICWYLCAIDNYDELGYIAHIIGGQRMLLKKAGKDHNIYADSLAIIQCKRNMLRDDKYLSDVLSKYFDWGKAGYKKTFLTFGEAHDYNEELEYQEKWGKH